MEMAPTEAKLWDLKCGTVSNKNLKNASGKSRGERGGREERRHSADESDHAVGLDRQPPAWVLITLKNEGSEVTAPSSHGPVAPVSCNAFRAKFGL
jgi:hypothetical protein